jgi:hypothetical protein
MDALNRHRECFFVLFLRFGVLKVALVRSEGGAECQKLVSASGMGPYQEQPPPLPVPKAEVDGGWGIVL